MNLEQFGLLLINFVYCIFCSFFILEIISVFFDVRILFKNKLIYICLSTLGIFSLIIISFFTDLGSSSIFVLIRFILGIIIYIMLNILVLKLKFMHSITATIIYFVFMFLFDLFSFFVANFFNFDIMLIRGNFAISLFYYSMLFVGSLAVLYIFKYIKHKNDNIQINNNRLFLTIVYLLITLFYILTNLYFYTSFSQLIKPSFIVVNSIVIVVYFVLTLYTTYNSQKLFNYTEENQNLKLYISSIDSLLNELKRFRHNYSNTLTSIQGFSNASDLEGLKIFLSELIETHQNTKNIDTFDFTKVSNPALKSIFLSKLSTALSKNIKVMFAYEANITNMQIHISDLCEILGVFLDNAIEECENLDLKNRRIEVFTDIVNDYFVLIVSNTFLDEPDISKIFKKDFSSKSGGNRGIGLYTVRTILDSYPHVILNTFVERNLFIQELQIKIK